MIKILKNTGETETGLSKHDYLKLIVIINEKIYILIKSFVFLFVFVVSVI